MATPALLRLAVRMVVFLLVLGLLFGAAVFGVPIGYYWWMQFQCWRAGPDSDSCWWLDLLEHPDKPRRRRGEAAVYWGRSRIWIARSVSVGCRPRPGWVRSRRSRSAPMSA